MKTVNILITLVLIFPSLGGSPSWSQYLGDPGRTAYSEYGSPQTPTLLWRTWMPGAFAASPFVADGSIIAFLRDPYQFSPYPNAQEKSTITQIDLLTGELTSYIDSEPQSPFWLVFPIGEEVFAKRGGDLLKVNFQSQKVTKVATIPEECPLFTCYPVVLKDTILFPTTSVMCLSQEDWSILWDLTTTLGTNSGSVLSVVVDDKNTFIIRENAGKNQILSVDSTTGKLHWSGPPTTAVKLALRDGVLFAAGDSLRTLDAETGELLWEFVPTSFIVSNVVVAPETVYVADSSNLYAVNRNTGALKWKTEWEGMTTGPVTPPYDFLIAGDDAVFCVGHLSDKGSVITAFDTKDGKELWKFSAYLRAPPILSEGILILNTIEGEMIAFTTEPDIFFRQGQLFLERGAYTRALYSFMKARQLYEQRNERENAQAAEAALLKCEEESAHRDVVIVANSVDMPAAQQLGTFLQEIGYQVLLISPGDLLANQNTERIVIIGGPDAYEGVGGYVQQVLTRNHEELLRMMHMVWVADRPWLKDQVIIVVAGPDRAQTSKAVEEYSDFVLCLLCNA